MNEVLGKPDEPYLEFRLADENVVLTPEFRVGQPVALGDRHGHDHLITWVSDDGRVIRTDRCPRSKR